MGLEAAGVKFSPAGIEADDHLRTTNPAVYAAGDAACRRSSRTRGSRRRSLQWPTPWTGRGSGLSDLVIPHCTYTDPEVAQVGITPQVAAEQGIAIDVHRLELAKVERAVIDGEADGFVALYTHNGVIVGGGNPVSVLLFG